MDPKRGLFLPILGFPVRIHPTFWLVAVLIGLPRGFRLAALVEWVGVVLVSILAHELGHALVASRNAVVYRITLHGAGGETAWRPLSPTGRWWPIVVSLAGAGCAVALAAWQVTPYLPESWLVELTAHDLVWVNVGWGLFNLLPIAPLDGGQALKTGLVAFSPGRGEWISAGVGVATAVAALLAARLAGQTWAALVVGIYGIQSGQVFAKHLQSRRDAHTHTRWQRLSARERASE
jgi:stage IV sporulation protein FB